MKEKIKKLKIEEIELKPSWSKLKSFHEKAYVGTKENGDKYLKSFGFLVCEIIKGEVKIHNEVNKWDSKSTIRHINNFLYENKFETGNTKKLTELYITKTQKIDKQEDKKENKTKTEKSVTTEDLKIEKAEGTEKTKKKTNNKTDVKVEKTKNQKSKNSKIENIEHKVKVGA